MTKDLSAKKPFFVRADLFVDFLMSAAFCFTVLSIAVVMKLYVQIVDLSYIHFLSILIPASLFILARRIRVKLPLMLLAHMFIFVFYLYTMSSILAWSGRNNVTASTVVLGVATFANLIYSMLQRLRATTGEVTYDIFIADFALHIVLYIVCVITKSDTTTIIMSHAVVIALLYFVARQLYTFDRRYYHNLHSATQPVAKIKKQNYQTIIVIFGGVFFALLLLFLFPTGALSRAITSILRSIGSFIGRFFKEETTTGDDGSGGSLSMDKKLPDLEDDGSGPSLFTKIIVVIVVMIIAFMIVAAVVFAIRQLLKLFKQAEDTERVVENDSVVDIIEDVTPKKSRSRFSRRNFGTGREREIRKKYFHTVQKAISSGTLIRPAYTPHQIESALKKKGDPSISELTSQYEAVRYGKKED